ncbi:MAG TPA: response regulator transcription factor [Acidimicrobiales bacterium]|nr:response regulator transcription factor [Acidimicrobiales bacterium]
MSGSVVNALVGAVQEAEADDGWVRLVHTHQQRRRRAGQLTSDGAPRTGPSALLAGRPAWLAGRMARIFLLDDHELVRRGIRDLLSAEDDLEVVGEASTAADALARIPSTHPDVAVLDVRLGDGVPSGIEACRDIRSSHPEVACVMLTSFADDEALFASLMAGAAGYVLKQIRGTDLVDAIRRVARGESLLDPAVTARVLDRLRHPVEEVDPLADPTEQQRRILGYIGEGFTNRQIAEAMFLAEKTVKNYVSGLLAKLGMARRTEAAAYAARLAERRRAAS